MMVLEWWNDGSTHSYESSVKLSTTDRFKFSCLPLISLDSFPCHGAIADPTRFYLLKQQYR
jgi:hypothetical protein